MQSFQIAKVELSAMFTLNEIFVDKKH